MGQRLVPADRRARLHDGRQRRSRLLPAVPADAGGPRTGARGPLRGSRDRRLARCRAGRVSPAVPARRRAAGGRRREARRALPRRLPDEPLPPGRLHGVALPRARAGRLPARGATGLGMLARIAGVALLLALALLAWRRPRAERGRALASLCLAPLIFAAYPLYLGLARGDTFAFARTQALWNRHLSPAGPLGG